MIKEQQEMEKKKFSKKKISIIVCLIIFVVGLPIVSFLMIKSMYDSNFKRAEMPDHTGWLRYDDLSGYDRTMVEFESGENTLTGYIYGEDNDKGMVVIAHGLGGGAESYMAETVYFVDQGWRVFSYDCTGSYRSEGEGTKGLPQSALDLDAALTYIEDQDYGLPVMLFGHSWGGYAVTAVLNYDHDISAVVSVSGYATPMELLDQQAGEMVGWLSKLAYPFEWLYQKALFGESADLSAVEGINKSEIPVMVIHGTEDEMIKYDGAAIIAHKDVITNPEVIYKPAKEEGHQGHNDIFRSEAAAEYIKEVNKEYDKLFEQYDGEVPDEEKEKFYSEVDKFKTSELDEKMMKEVNTFFEDSLK